ncbi:MAG TPA: CheR family methyltransferase, partial [Blastocatellia bacterium]|nr:CheR family methyltransferase [Blastocatellia bacterium]
MKFLYQKEFASRAVKPSEVAAFVASLYQERGHSTDTQIEANFALHTALAALKAQHPETKLNKVLIVGPGMDFAPRTDLIDLFGPQSYQPFAIADSLLALKLAETSRLKIHCVDINDRVLAYLQALGARKEVSLSILSGVKDSAARPLTEDFKDYFRGFGQSIGVESGLEVPARFAGHLKKSLRIRPEVVSAVSAGRLNIVTERYQNSPQYDLVIVTNVFPYFSAPELLFALTNIQAMTAEGGYLIHNELQTVSSNFVNALGLPLRQARTVMIASDSAAPLFDGVAIHQKNPRS